MKRVNLILTLVALFLFSAKTTMAQNNSNLKLSGYLQTDQRLLLQSPNDWAWNENRLSLQLNKKIAGRAKFHSEVWLRNMGIPNISSSTDLFNKGIIDPWNLEIREAYVQLFGFLTKNLDVKIGRQRIAWGTADKFNPTDNLNPYDLEDVLDFGRHRGSDALNMIYYLNSDFSLQGVFIPFFQPDNLPVGVFANILNQGIKLPPGMILKGYKDHVNLPRYNFAKSSTVGIKLRGFAAGFNFSLSYVWGRNGLPVSTYNTIVPVDTLGGVSVTSQLSFYRRHIFGADMAGNIEGVGVWAEAAAFLPAHEVVMTNDLSAFYPEFPVPVTQKTRLLAKKIYVKYVLGADYNFANGAYINVQFLHGFMNEAGKGNLNDYFFVRVEKRFFYGKLRLSPLSGGFVVSNWKDIRHNYALVYVPQLSYQATDNAEITLSAAIFGGKGESIFARLKGYNMIMLKMKYSF